jgi:hypothetical protein
MSDGRVRMQRAQGQARTLGESRQVSFCRISYGYPCADDLFEARA